MTERWHIFLCQHLDRISKTSLLHFLKGAGCSGIYKNPNIDGGTCTAKWVLISSILWHLLVPFCTVMSGTSPHVDNGWKQPPEARIREIMGK